MKAFYLLSSSTRDASHFPSPFKHVNQVDEILSFEVRSRAIRRGRGCLIVTERSLAELYDARREKPSVLVTSPGSPDLHAQGRARHLRHASSGNANVGGNLQVKLSFDPAALRLIVTLICAAGLTPRSNGQPRNPYAKIFLLPDKR